MRKRLLGRFARGEPANLSAVFIAESIGFGFRFDSLAAGGCVALLGEWKMIIAKRN